jgi:hypothetical protein
MKILYRFTDNVNTKGRPFWFNKRVIYKHAVALFSASSAHEFFVFADNATEDTLEFLRQNTPNSENHVFCTTLGNAKSFVYICQYAIEHYNDDDIIYFAEDDYVYVPEASFVLEEAFTYCGADYVTGYDHPDKYCNVNDNMAGNPQVKNGGELTRVLLSKNRHWKHTNSTCMTFGVRLKTIKQDFDVIKNHCSGDDPGDYSIFCCLIQERGRKLLSPIPALCTHAEQALLAPLIDWSIYVT